MNEHPHISEPDARSNIMNRWRKSVVLNNHGGLEDRETEDPNSEKRFYNQATKLIPPTIRQTLLHIHDPIKILPEGVHVDYSNNTISIAENKARLGGIYFPITDINWKLRNRIFEVLMAGVSESIPDTLITVQEPAQFCSFVNFGEEEQTLIKLSELLRSSIIDQLKSIIAEDENYRSRIDGLKISDFVCISLGQSPSLPITYSMREGSDENFLLAQNPLVDGNSIKGAVASKGAWTSSSYQENCQNGFLPLLYAGEEVDKANIKIELPSKDYSLEARQARREDYGVQEIEIKEDCPQEDGSIFKNIAVGTFWTPSQIYNFCSQEQISDLVKSGNTVVELSALSTQVNMALQYDLSGLSKLQKNLHQLTNAEVREELTRGMYIIMTKWQDYCVELLQSVDHGVDEFGGDGCRGLARNPDLSNLLMYLDTSLRLAESFELISLRAERGDWGMDAQAFVKYARNVFSNNDYPIVKVVEDLVDLSLNLMSTKSRMNALIGEYNAGQEIDLMSMVKIARYHPDKEIRINKHIVAIGPKLREKIINVQSSPEFLEAFEIIDFDGYLFLGRRVNK